MARLLPPNAYSCAGAACPGIHSFKPNVWTPEIHSTDCRPDKALVLQQKNRSRWEGATLGGLFRATVWSSRRSCRSICRRHQTVQTQGRGGDLVNQMARGWYPDSNDDTAEI
jgi:hypothetical protein